MEAKTVEIRKVMEHVEVYIKATDEFLFSLDTEEETLKEFAKMCQDQVA